MWSELLEVTSFFENYNESISNEEVIKVVQMVKELKTRDSYITDVVFYKLDNEYLITATGIISKEDFFDYAYYNNKFDRFFWEDIMLKYDTPTFIPLNNYSIQDNMVKRIFIIPKIYPLYNNIGVIIFVGENSFIDFFGLLYKNINAKIRLFDENGDLILSNVGDPVTKKFPIEKIKNKPFIIMRSVLGKYTYYKWTEYESIIFSFEKANYSFIWFCFICILLLIGMLHVFKLINRTALHPVINQNFAKQACIVLMTKDKDFYMKNKQIIDEVLCPDEKQRFIFIAVLFINSNWRDKKPINFELEQIIKSKSIVIPLNQHSYTLLLSFSHKKEEVDMMEIEDITNRIQQAYCAHGQVQVICGNIFTSIHNFNKEYQKLLYKIGKTGFNNDQAPKLLLDIPVSLRTTLSKYINDGDRKGIKSYLGNIIDNNINANVSFDAMYYLYVELYYEIVSIVTVPLGEEQLKSIDELFFDSIRSNFDQLNFELMKNILFNTVDYLIEMAEKSDKHNNKREISRFLEDNFTSDLYIDLIAEKFGMTSRQFTYYFKKEFGVGFNEYITQLRLAEGEKLLINTNLPVNVISERVGYQNSSAFIIAFKKHIGITPNIYRNEKIKNKSN